MDLFSSKSLKVTARKKHRKRQKHGSMLALWKRGNPVRVSIWHVTLGIMAFLVLMEWRKDFYTATRGREDHEHRENDFDKHDHGIFSVPEEKSKPPVNMSPKIKHILEEETSQQIEHEVEQYGSFHGEEYVVFDDIESFIQRTVSAHNLTVFERTTNDTEFTPRPHKGDNYTRLSATVYRVALFYNVSRILDTSCYVNRHWMGDTVRAIDKVARKRQLCYVCIDNNPPRVQAEVAPQMTGLKCIMFMRKALWQDILPRSDLLIGWESLQSMSPQRVQNFTNNLKLTKSKYVMVTDNPDVQNTADYFALKYHRKALMKEPYAYPTPEREFTGLASDKTKHFLLYKTASLPTFEIRQ